MLLGPKPINKFLNLIEFAKDAFKFCYQVVFSRYILLLVVFCIYDITDSKYNYSFFGQIMLKHRHKQDYYLLVWAFKHYQDRVLRYISRKFDDVSTAAISLVFKKKQKGIKCDALRQKKLNGDKKQRVNTVKYLYYHQLDDWVDEAECPFCLEIFQPIKKAVPKDESYFQQLWRHLQKVGYSEMVKVYKYSKKSVHSGS